MTESAGYVTGINESFTKRIKLEITLEPIDDTIAALAQVYEWRIGEKAKVIGNEPKP